MISDTNQETKLYENGSLLDDLFFYVDAGTNCKLLLIGDTAQLPPVNMTISPALDVDTLSLHYQKNVHHIELDEVMRQTTDSEFYTTQLNYENYYILILLIPFSLN